MLELLAEAIQRTNYALVPRPRQFQQLPMQAGLGSDVASANNEGPGRQRHALAPPSLTRCVTHEARAMIKRLDEVEERGCRKRNAQRQQQQPPFRVLLDGL